MATTCKLLVLLALLLMLPAGAYAQLGPDALPSNAQLDSLRQRLRASVADTNRVNQLLLLGRFYTARFAGGQHKADTVLLLARQAQALSQKLHYAKGQGNSYLVSAEAWLQKDDRAQGQAAARQAIALFSRMGNARLTAQAYGVLSNFLGMYTQDFPELTRCYGHQLALYRQLGDVRAQAATLADRSTSYMLQGNNELAINDLQTALRLYRSVGHRQLSTVYSRLSRAHGLHDDYKNALNYGLLAIREIEARRDSSTAAIEAYTNVGGAYLELGNRKKAVEYYQKALALVKTRPYTEIGAMIVADLTGTLEVMGQSAAALRLLDDFDQRFPVGNDEFRRFLANAQRLGLYTHLKQYARARYYYGEVLAQLKPLQPDDLHFSFAYPRIIPFLLATRQYELAREYLAREEGFHRRRPNSLPDLLQNQRNWFRLDSTMGNYAAAIRHYQHLIALKDSLFTQAKTKEISRLDVQYQTERKDQEIKLQKQNIQLLGKQKLLQAQELQRVQLLRNGAAIGVILLLLLLALGYNRYQLKQRATRLLEAKQAEINQQNQSLAQVVQEKEGLLVEKEGLIEEKEWMLKEIHHRVKNNLQVIKSLLNLQSDFLQDPAALHAMRESQNRVHAMALIHQKLYQSDTLARVNMQEYIQDIVDYLVHCFDKEYTVQPQLDVAALELDVAIATPLGLLLNEAVTNSLKYAFPQQQRGIIAVTLVPEATPNHYRLTIADDGVGLPEGFRAEKAQTLGMTMIKGLSKQLGADLTITQYSGVQITLRFTAARKPARVAATSA